MHWEDYIPMQQFTLISNHSPVDTHTYALQPQICPQAIVEKIGHIFNDSLLYVTCGYQAHN